MSASAACGASGTILKRMVRQITAIRNLYSYHIWLVNISGGKDSQELLRAIVELATLLGMRDRIVLVHADLGRVEWEGTIELVKEWAQYYDLPLHVVRRTVKGKPQDLIEQIRQRRKFPDASRRFCTSDQKRGPVRILMTALVQALREKGCERVRILNIMGMRAEESGTRAKRPAFSHDGSRTCPCDECQLRVKIVNQYRTPAVEAAFKALSGKIPKALKIGSGASNTRRHVDEWLPIHAWTEDEVWAGIAVSGTRTHWAYKYMPRLSCRFCVLASRSALVMSAKLNPELAEEYAALEAEIGHDFRNGLSMRRIIQIARSTSDIEHVENWNA